MAIFKCKMCGGALDIPLGINVGTCSYCGSAMTLPKLDDEKRANLYDRANHFRRNNEYDKASAIYESILNEDKSDAEAYWSLVLCKFGVEYVQDPASNRRIPTCNRTQYTSIFSDENYKEALTHAEGYQGAIYEQEAKAIDTIQRGILELSQKETPFDVFLCYKETDKDGKRTQESVLAVDLFHQLTQEGFRVFCSRVTLEDKLGTAYEPYIFAALQSSKVMVVLGTRAENFNAVWVKNEWSRYLSLIKSGAKKTLIPAYRDMDPYDMPDEFSHLQALDMEKIGFTQDLIRGIKKIAESGTQVSQTPQIVQVSTNTQVEPLMKRAFICLEDGDWKKADELLEQVLNIEPENAKAYVGKLMSEIKVHKEIELPRVMVPISRLKNFKNALRFADENYRMVLEKYDSLIQKAISDKRNEQMENIYREAKTLLETDLVNSSDLLGVYINALEKFQSISNYKDSAFLVERCQIAIDEINIKIEKQRETAEIMRNLKIFGIILVIAAVFFLLLYYYPGRTIFGLFVIACIIGSILQN